MSFANVDHIAFITPDLDGTVRFYRDLLGMRLTLGIGHDGFRHYFFECGDNLVAFFHYEGASKMEVKFHGRRTEKPLGFDHLAFTVPAREDLFELKDRLEAAGLEVTGPIDHGVFWSIYFFDNNNIPLEFAWNLMEVVENPAVVDDDLPDIVLEGADPQPGHWPEATKRTALADMVPEKTGNAFALRKELLASGKARITPAGRVALEALEAAQEAEAAD
ncbi:MAG: VOC family protein [Minwuia sp.]|uniref:VOC family protein n=1 Tax=Minwuia sp. TaxID=2493630 RepID=UPI003A8677AF